MSEPVPFRSDALKEALDLPDSVPNLYHVVEKEGASGEYEIKIDFMETGVAYNGNECIFDPAKREHPAAAGSAAN